MENNVKKEKNTPTEEATANANIEAVRSLSQVDVTGTDAEDVRAMTRAMTGIKGQLTESYLLKRKLQTDTATVDKKLDESYENLNKKTAELQSLVTSIATKNGLNLNEGWQFNLDTCRFVR